MNESLNPYAPPDSEILTPPESPLGTWSTFCKACVLYVRHFPAIAVIVLVVSIPMELACNYATTFELDWNQLILQATLISEVSDHLVGIIPMAGVIFFTLNRMSGRPASPGASLMAALRSWPKMFWTNQLSTLILIPAGLLLVVPFLVLYPYLILMEVLVMAEGLSGTEALKRSMALTRRCFWPVFRIGFLSMGIQLAISQMLSELQLSVPEFDHWLGTAFECVLETLAGAFELVILCCIYQARTTPAVRELGETDIWKDPPSADVRISAPL
ncbi:hypothetical protein [Brevifollis gellanilyticus]|uniref:DUF7847 domain-containing protein n=1 Tax=Brevifollis gellanilyticus TaxID=748831 RepID=A0A512M6Y2_9BACT|nr:hypothetical protein [Brevifollis gellanilyticus]GEP42091.1 hypothetical protein BGE01nite_13820 [Brevifollis gellanilyticus]